MKLPKPIILALMSIFIMSSSSVSKDKEDHSLVSLWKEYYAATSADRPKTAESVLLKIKAEAKAAHLTWDYYDASVQLARIRTSANWKLRDSEIEVRDKDIRDFGEPVAEFFLNINEYHTTDTRKAEFAKEHKEALKKARNPEFYTRDWNIKRLIYGNLMPDLLKNDYEYCLWSVTDGGTLTEEFKSYPLSAFAEYERTVQQKINISSETFRQKLEDYARKWDGKAAGLLAEQHLIELRYEQAKTSEQYASVRDDCKALNKKRDAFKGDEKKIAQCITRTDAMLENMSIKTVFAEVTDGVAKITVRNLDAVTLQLFREKTKVWETRVNNPYKSYYVEDGMSVPLPDVDDGTYTLKCFRDRTEHESEYHKYTISLAIRRDASGPAIWATDFMSGEPLKKVQVELLKDDKVIEKADLAIDGYTPLPQSFASALYGRRSYHSLRARTDDGRKRMSGTVSLYDRGDYSETDDKDLLQAVLLTDRGAYNPDEVMHFKAVLYRGKYSLRAAEAGIEVEVELKDPSGRSIETRSMTTGEFGSIAADMVLKRGEKNGRYQLTVRRGAKTLCTRSILVDDFVLPTFDLVFERPYEFRRPVSELKIAGRVFAYSGHSLSGAKIRYRVLHYGNELASGDLNTDADDRFELSFPADASNDGYDWYQVIIKVVDSTGETMEWNRGVSVMPLPTKEEKKDYYFEHTGEDGRLELKAVAGDKPVWMIVEAHGPGNALLWKRLERFAPEHGAPAQTTVSYSMKPADPEVMLVNVIYFQNKRCFTHSAELRKPDRRWDLDLQFSRFIDTTAPGAGYTFEIKTAAGVELAASIFDKSTERYYGNAWSRIRPRLLPSPWVETNNASGTNDSAPRIMFRSSGMRAMAKNSMAMASMDTVVEEEGAVERVAAATQDSEEAAAAVADIPIRENFANTIAWEPFLRSDADGNVKFSFTNADKLSTYYVQLFAHDKGMRNETLRREMVVTIPVKISLVEPRYLYEGDRYIARIALSSSLSGDLAGTLTVQTLNGSDHKTAPVISTVSRKVTVPARGSVSQDIIIDAPLVKDLGIKAVFVPESGTYGSDGVFVCMPVKKPVQTLTEAHSAVLLSGADKAALEAELRAMFKNVDGSVPPLQEIDIRQMIRDAVPAELDVPSDNAISLARALYAWSLCRDLGIEPAFDRDGAIGKLRACIESDGGIAWFAGMGASPLVTAAVLRLVHGLGVIDEAASVQYLDARFFDKKKTNWWYRGISMEQYLHTRSLFPEVQFKARTDSDFRKAARAYLVPRKERGLNANIAAKARRVQTLDNLLSLDGGTSLASKMGIRLGITRRLRKSLAADVASLVEYAQPHKSGGSYYPNAVMPWRGLLETELDAHCALIAIMDRFGHSDISDGIRLWIMLQKETQNWKQYSGYIEAIGAVLNGPESVLNTKVLALKAEYTAPFESIRAFGNGMTIASIPDGTTLRIGDRVSLSYNITNEENRSFVKVTIPFGAGLVPVNQISGYNWRCYRNVLADRIELWYEVYPEEKTGVSEEFYVTRAGSFQAPVATIECEYAPHYRANDAWNGRLEIAAE